MPADLAPLRADSRRHRVTDALRQEILAGRMRPGDRLVELDLAAQLGTSRAPVRDAIHQLEHEGLVISYPYRGAEVAGVSPEEVVEVLVPIRVTIETFAFQQALAHLTDTDLAALSRFVDAMRESASNGDDEATVDADIAFHELVIARSGQTHCLQIWRAIQPRVRLYFRYDVPRHARADDVAAQHRELLDALRTRDPDTVRRVLVDHIHTRPASATSAPSATPATAAPGTAADTPGRQLLW